MKKSLAWFFVMATVELSANCGVAGAAKPMAGPEHKATPHEQLAAEQSATPQQQSTPKQQAAAENLGLPVTMTNSIGTKLVLIPAGEFLMGNLEDPEELVREYGVEEASRVYVIQQPPHRVRITKPFYLGMYEVTVGQFRHFIEAKAYRTEGERDGKGGYGFTGKTWEQKPEYSWRNVGFPQTDAHPVVNVSWNDAAAFCQWLSAKEGYTYRLPTEAEWEYACRAGTITRFSNGDDPNKLTSVGNVADAVLKATVSEVTWCMSSRDGYVFTSPVGRFQVNPWGLYDMHGNVWEWCADWYGQEYFGNSPVVDPPGAATGSYRVYRGGSWDSSALLCHSASRIRRQPYSRYDFLGFRVAAVQSADGTEGNTR